MELALNTILNNISLISDDIRIAKNSALELNDMGQYNLCNEIRVNFFNLRQQIINQLTNVVEDKDSDISIIKTQKEITGEQLSRLTEIKNLDLVQSIFGRLVEIENVAEIFFIQTKILNKEQKAKLLDQIFAFKYSLYY